jgi:hypothetical protein
MKIVHKDPPLENSRNWSFLHNFEFGKFSRPERKFLMIRDEETKWSILLIFHMWHHYPHSKGREKEIPPFEFWIRGGFPVCIAKDVGDKLTRRETIG